MPAVSFVLLTVVRAWINRPRPYEAFEVSPVIKKDTKGNSDFIFRFSEHGVYRKGECVFRFYTNDKGDICALTTYQWKDSEV